MNQENSLENWKELSLNLKSDGTADTYQKLLKLYLKHRKVTPDEMAEWNKEKATNELLRYIGKLKRNGIAEKSMGISWYAIRDFFRANGIKIDEKLPISTKKRRYRDMIPTKQQLRKILDHSPLQVKLGISLMAFSGLSPIDAVNLTYGDFKDDLDADITPIMLTIRRQKTGNEFVTFVPDQAIRYLKEWLEYRQRKGEEINDDTPIFTWNKSSSMSLKQTEYIKKAGIKIRNGYRLRNYCFRKYFKRGMMGKVDESLAEFFMGHETDLAGIYSGLIDLDLGAIEKARQEYSNAIPELVTEGEISISDFNDLKGKIERLEEENQMLKERLNGFNIPINKKKAMEMKDARDMLDGQLALLLEDREVKDFLVKKLKEGIKKEGGDPGQ